MASQSIIQLSAAKSQVKKTMSKYEEHSPKDDIIIQHDVSEAELKHKTPQIQVLTKVNAMI